MIDMFNTPSDKNSTQVFYCIGSNTWQTWQKPSGVNFVYMFVIGGGSGGGGGRTVANNSSPGGGGGASSGITVGIFQAALLPDTIHLLVGQGGNGGPGNTTGSAGEISYVTVAPNINNTNIILQSSDAAPTGGGGAFSTTGVGAGGTAATAWTYTNAVFGDSGIITTSAGQNGTSGTGLGGFVNNLTPVLPVTGGAGGGAVSGGGTAFGGGNILGTSYLPQVSTGVINAADETITGRTGLFTVFANSQNPMFFLGGAGGAAASTIGRSGGSGGAGSYGCGGGGGAGTFNGTAGSGGKGGDGLIMIVCV